MKQITSWLGVTSLTFMLGVATAFIWLEFRRPAVQEAEAVPCFPTLANENASSDLPILAYCELANNPDKYSGKVVRVSAKLSGFIHGILFYDSNCAGIETRTSVTYNPQNRGEIERSLNEARGSDDWFEPVNLIAVGKFEKVVPNNQSDTIYDTASLRFEIVNVERASKAR